MANWHHVLTLQARKPLGSLALRGSRRRSIASDAFLFHGEQSGSASRSSILSKQLPNVASIQSVETGLSRRSHRSVRARHPRVIPCFNVRPNFNTTKNKIFFGLVLIRARAVISTTPAFATSLFLQGCGFPRFRAGRAGR